MWLSAVLSALMIANTLPSGVMASETATAFDPGDTTEKPLILWYNKPSAKTADIIDNSVLDRAGWDEYSLPIQRRFTRSCKNHGYIAIRCICRHILNDKLG